jgi:hypothetical protein
VFTSLCSGDVFTSLISGDISRHYVAGTFSRHYVESVIRVILNQLSRDIFPQVLRAEIYLVNYVEHGMVASA